MMIEWLTVIVVINIVSIINQLLLLIVSLITKSVTFSIILPTIY